MNNQRDIQLHKEIKDYKESIFFGLSMRQSFFSAIAAIVAVIVYFCLRPHFGTETLSWMCILSAIPFAALGFVNYHGLNAEQLFWAWLKSDVIEKGVTVFKPTTAYYEHIKDIVMKKEGKKRYVKNSKKNNKAA